VDRNLQFYRAPWESLLGIKHRLEIQLPYCLFNYGNKPPKTKNSRKESGAANTINTDKTDKAHVKGTNHNHENNNTPTETNCETEEEKLAEFAVLRGTKAAALAELRRDTPRQEAHKQSINNNSPHIV
jgi:hypothetical protein